MPCVWWHTLALESLTCIVNTVINDFKTRKFVVWDESEKLNKTNKCAEVVFCSG